AVAGNTMTSSTEARNKTLWIVRTFMERIRRQGGADGEVIPWGPTVYPTRTKDAANSGQHPQIDCFPFPSPTLHFSLLPTISKETDVPHFDVFNGDADGICALHQLRLADPRESTLITGAKRDINLLRRVQAQAGDTVTVLDISLDKNRDDLGRLLDAGVRVDYFDHHFAGEIPDSPNLTATIDTAGDVCTGLLVNRFLKSAFLPWAVTALFGDNLHDAARTAAEPLNLDASQLQQLETLGTLLNYNGYGSKLEDLYFAPDDLYRKIKPYADPFDFIASDKTFEALHNGFESDMNRASSIAPVLETEHCAVFSFPDESFSRRVSGVYSNQLARDNPHRAHALASLLPSGEYLVSVRAPLDTKTGADELCRKFPTGGGRQAAAGINELPADQFQAFLDAIQEQFR
ncbi:MAG: hypothetical protein KDB00_21725, partial [Planctomycetales bacterium]|nr:hypothetical protein [Planctomycetales bacterium]